MKEVAKPAAGREHEEGGRGFEEHLSSLEEGTDVNQYRGKNSVEGTVKAGTWAELLVVVTKFILLASNFVDLPSPARWSPCLGCAWRHSLIQILVNAACILTFP